MARSATPILMFQGTAEEAMNFYVAVFKGASIRKEERYGPGEPGTEGSVKVAEFEIAGQTFLCIDSPVRHDFSFTPAISSHVECESEEELKDLFYRLGSGGAVFMPLDDYGFSRLYGWLSDRFGVSWQLNLK